MSDGDRDDGTRRGRDGGPGAHDDGRGGGASAPGNDETGVTRLLDQVQRGVPGAQDRLLAAVYRQLRRIAGARMRGQRPGHTLQPTALVHEAYLKLVGAGQSWKSRSHFVAVAAKAMRQVLINHARDRAAQKRGGGALRVTFSDLQVQADDPDVDVLALNEALEALADMDERLARVVDLRYFGGFTVEETAELLDTSPATVKRDWNYARAWLFERMSGEPAADH